MRIEEVQDFHEIILNNLEDNIHVIYEKICHMEPKMNEENLIVGTIVRETYEEISVYEEKESLIKKASYRINKDVNSTIEALNLIIRLFAPKKSA